MVKVSRPCPNAPMFEGLRFNHWKTSLDDSGIVTLTLDRAHSSVNAISREVLLAPFHRMS